MKMESILRACEERAVMVRDLKPMTGEDGIIIRIARNEEYSVIDFDPDFAVLIRNGKLFPIDHVLNRVSETHNLIKQH
jgi:predicted nuclease of predicted toxin-antitoxin system